MNGDDKIKGPEVDKYMQETAGILTREMFNLINETAKPYDKNFEIKLTLSVISSMIGTMVLRALISDQPATDSAVIKNALELSIANGFTAAFDTVNPDNSPADFICQVHHFGEPVNKLPA